jgi:hypothetical protein
MLNSSDWVLGSTAAKQKYSSLEHLIAEDMRLIALLWTKIEKQL